MKERQRAEGEGQRSEEGKKLSDLPMGWTLSTVGQLYEIVGGGTPSTKIEDYWTGDIPWVTSADIHGVKDVRPRKLINQNAIKGSTTNIVPKGSILVVTRVGLGKVALTDTPLCFSQDTQALTLDESLLDPKYSLHYLSRAVQVFKHENRGTTISGVTKKQLSSLSFPLPPLPEQHRIVTKIEELFSSLDKGVEDLKTAQQQLKIYRQAVLKWAFEGRLTNKDVVDEELPGGWGVCALETLIEQPKYGTSKKCHYGRKGRGVLRIPNIGNGIVDNSDLKYAEFDKKELETYGLKEGDILTIRSNGSVDLVGKCAVVGSKDEDYMFAGYLIRLRPKQETILSRYLLYALSSHKLRDQIEARAKSTSGVNNVNSEELKSLVMPVCSVAEQQLIVAEIESRLSVCDKIEETITDSLKQAESLRQSILKKAFGGKLVPQDPNDEPASALLARISAERNTRRAAAPRPRQSGRKAHS
jgi:type I restriction enzyme, S subunit